MRNRLELWDRDKWLVTECFLTDSQVDKLLDSLSAGLADKDLCRVAVGYTGTDGSFIVDHYLGLTR